MKGVAVLTPIVIAAGIAAYQENENFRNFVDASVSKAEQFWNNVKRDFSPEEMRRRHDRRVQAWGMRPEDSPLTTTIRTDQQRGPRKENVKVEVDETRSGEAVSSRAAYADVEVVNGDQDGLRRRKGATEAATVPPTTNETLIDIEGVDLTAPESATQSSSVFFEAEESSCPNQSIHEHIDSLSADFQIGLQTTHSENTPSEDTSSMHNSVFEDDPLNCNPFADPNTSSHTHSASTSSLSDSLPHPLRSNPIEVDTSSAAMSLTSSSDIVHRDDGTRSISGFSEAYTDAESEVASHMSLNAEDEDEEAYEVLTPTSEDTDDMMSEASFTSGWSEVDSAASHGSNL